jgi:hypothetical protein
MAVSQPFEVTTAFKNIRNLGSSPRTEPRRPGIWFSLKEGARDVDVNVLYHSPPGLASQQHVLGAFVRDALSCK